jgi:hypothetical protein
MEVSDQVHAPADSRNEISLLFENVASEPDINGKEKTPFSNQEQNKTFSTVHSYLT